METTTGYTKLVERLIAKNNRASAYATGFRAGAHNLNRLYVWSSQTEEFKEGFWGGRSFFEEYVKTTGEMP